MTYCIIKFKCTWVRDPKLRTLLSLFQSQIVDGLVHLWQNICIIILFTYTTYIIYSIYTYVCLKCTQFMKFNGGNSSSVVSLYRWHYHNYWQLNEQSLQLLLQSTSMCEIHYVFKLLIKINFDIRINFYVHR